MFAKNELFVNSVKKFIFGTKLEISLNRRIYILLTFLSTIIVFIGLITNFFTGLNNFANITLTVGLIIGFSFYLIARKSENYKKSIIPLLIFTLVLISFTWFFNAGYNGNITYLIFIFFLAFYLIIPKKYRLSLMIVFIFLNTSLISIHYHFPELIINYENDQQRYADLIIGNILYLFFMYFIIDIYVVNFHIEHQKIKSLNEKLKFKNDEIAKNNKILKESTERLELAFRVTAQSWFDYDIPTNIIRVNPEFIGLLGYSSEEAMINFESWLDMIHLDDIENFKSIFYEIINSDNSFSVEYRIRTKSGDWKWIKSGGKIIEFLLDGKPARMIGIHLDIDDKKKNEEIIKDKESKYLDIFNSSNDGIMIQEIFTNKIIDVNNTFLKLYNYDNKEEVLNLSIEDLSSVEEGYDNNKINQVMEIAVVEGSNNFEWKAKKKNGEVFFVDVTLRKITVGNNVRIMANVRDISERKQSEEIMQKLHTAINNTRDVLFITDINGIITYMNNEFSNLYGFTREDVIGKVTPRILKSGFTPAEYAEYTWKSLLNKERIVGEYINKTKKGDFVDVEGSAEAILNSDGDIIGFIGIQRDIRDRKKAEKILRETEEKFRFLFENMTVGFALHEMIYDENQKPVDYRYIEINPAFEKLTGAKKSDLIGKTVKEVMPNTEQYWIDTYSEVALTGKSLAYENFAQEINKYFSVWAFSPEKNKFAVIFSDITDRKLMEQSLVESNAKINALIENTKDSIWSVDTNYNLVFINEVFRNAFKNNYGIELNVGSNILDTVPDEMRKVWKERYDITLKNEHYVFEEKYELNGIENYVEISMNPIIADTKVIGVSVFSRNISERKNAEKLLIEQNKELESQYEEYMQLNEILRQTNYDLEIAIKKAEESDKLKTAFLQNISHEIRTPLNGIIGFSRLLSQRNNSQSEVLEYTGIIQQSGNRLIEIINNVLDISKIETGQVEIIKKYFSVNSLITDLFTIFKPMAQSNLLELKYQTELSDDKSIILTDEAKINQILSNLINNAIKFTKKGKIEFGYTLENEFIKFYITDTGIGIPVELHNKIFMRFSQAEDTIGRNFEGAGLGLAICKGLVELLDGKIWLESQVNVGSTFYFSLPVSLDNKIENIIIEEKKSDLTMKRPKILIAEDDYTSYRFIRKVLENNNYEVIYAENGLDAVQIVKNDLNIDLILMDIRMPVLDGLAATKEIKLINPNIPVIAQTAYAFAQEKEQILDVGCNDYISKPVEMDMLLKLIHKYLK